MPLVAISVENQNWEMVGAYAVVAVAALSQVDFPLGGVAGGRAGGGVLTGHAQWHLLQWAVLAGGVASTGVGTARGRDAGPLLLPPAQPGAAIGQAPEAPPLLVRHKGGELGRVARLADGRGLPGHPAGVRVAQLSALLGAVARHGHVGQGSDICQGDNKKKTHVYLI